MRRRRLHRRKRKLRNKKIIIASICLICIMSVGFAAFQTNLSLKATGNIKEKYFTVNFKTQLLKNENFENGLDNWTFGGCSDSANIALDTDIKYNGYDTVRIHEDTTDCFNGILQILKRSYDENKTYQLLVNLYRDSSSSYGDLTNLLRTYVTMDVDSGTTWLRMKETNNAVIPTYPSSLPNKVWTTFSDVSVGIAGTSSEVKTLYYFRLDYTLESETGVTTPSTVWLASPRLYETETKEIKGYKAIGTLPTATKEGYTFIGWYTEEYGGEKIDENNIIKEDMDLYAHFDEN